MGSTMFVDTTLDLNLNPLHHGEKVPMRELNGAYPEFERKPPVAEEAGVLVEELHRMTSENKRLTEMLTTVCENYHALQKRFVEMIGKEKDQIATSRKRKADTDQDCCNMIGFNNCQAESSSSEEDQSCKRPKEHNVKAPVSRVYVRVDASNPSLVVKDGYQWRKYGQKVTRDNPSPRAYFKCSFAPSCPVKKKVQRSAEDPSILVATYEGEHNHSHPSQANLSLSPSHGAALGRVPVSCSMMTSSAATVTLDLIQPAGVSRNYIGSVQENDQLPAIQQILVEQMASSLTRDPNFTATLAAAISGRFLDKTRIHDPQN